MGHRADFFGTFTVSVAEDLYQVTYSTPMEGAVVYIIQVVEPDPDVVPSTIPKLIYDPVENTVGGELAPRSTTFVPIFIIPGWGGSYGPVGGGVPAYTGGDPYWYAVIR